MSTTKAATRTLSRLLVLRLIDTTSHANEPEHNIAFFNEYVDEPDAFTEDES